MNCINVIIIINNGDVIIDIINSINVINLKARIFLSSLADCIIIFFSNL